MIDIKWHDENAEKLTLHEKDGVIWLSFPLLDREKWLGNSFSTRFGGVSSGCLASMNLSFARESSRENVLENFRRFSMAAGFSPDHIICSDQTHTANIRLVHKNDCGAGISRPLPWNEIDGLITNEPGCVLTTFYADCVPIFLADPVHRAIGLCHSGWRGTVRKISQKAILAMQEDFGSRPEDLLAQIGPSICRESYEVSRETAEKFDWKFSKKKDNGKYLLDLWEANRDILLMAGIPASHIGLPNLCTACNPELLFSHRASGGKRGNMAAFLEIKET